LFSGPLEYNSRMLKNMSKRLNFQAFDFCIPRAY
jgi:hypothetical protein